MTCAIYYFYFLISSVLFLSLGCNVLFPYEGKDKVEVGQGHPYSSLADGSLAKDAAFAETRPDQGIRDSIGDRPADQTRYLEATPDLVRSEASPPDLRAGENRPIDAVVIRDISSSMDGLLSLDARPFDILTLDMTSADANQCIHPVVTETCANGWCTIPAGCFTMGSPSTELCHAADETLHQVTLTHPFLIGATEVTQSQFSAVMGAAPSFYKACGPTCPVESVSWHQAAAYCNALTSAPLTPCYSCTGTGSSTICALANSSYAASGIYNCSGYRLPTEAEWEYAIRAGSTTASYQGAISTCQNKSDAVADMIAWYAKNSSNNTHPVAGKLKNQWGLSDMAGNVSEWTGDWYQVDLGAAPAVDPSGPVTGMTRVVRGGSFFDFPFPLRSAYRGDWDPGNAYTNFGFRCARSLSQ